MSSIAVATPETLIAELTLQVRKTHSEQLMPHIASILAMAEITCDQLAAIAVSIGPGSFTGLRIGLATAKALAYALAIPILGVPTLAALAYSCPLPGVYLSPMLDAQKGNVYQAIFEWRDGELCEVMPARVVPFAQAKDEMKNLPQPTFIMGEAAVMYRQEINLPLLPHVIMPRAGSAAILAQKMLRDGVTHDVYSLEPLYIRRSEAEELWEKRQAQVFSQKDGNCL
ncbi:tRNA threonylcarbamoyladenosine biosynthesis protein TsaB [Methylomusa anaerophila]|uniref:tRNA threonylcarbamoyladenosine biosynthesis protein TsaB n=1 Tax=Methylomusa anaerophila TaxID=1930071 RepID=A0A348AMK2_9FIRM|nr:tRNA threonylcarbamoyladenosine biosynthesis protein TsaB [Methylomusa anaerophila]